MPSTVQSITAHPLMNLSIIVHPNIAHPIIAQHMDYGGDGYDGWGYD